MTDISRMAADDHLRLKRRHAFDEDPELYDRIRPDYPREAVADLVRLAGMDGTTRVLEIGPGTGQLTVALATVGCEIVGVELGAGLAAVASRRLAAYPRVTVVNDAFETWPLPSEPFDAVVAATSFHWLDPETRVGKAVDALRPGGTLAVLSTDHVAGGTEPFFTEVQACYERWDASTPPGVRLEPADGIPDGADEFQRSGRFSEVITRRYARDITYTTADYLDILRSYSGHRALSANDRSGLLDCVGRLIDNDFGGQVTKRYQTRLLLARRT